MFDLAPNSKLIFHLDDYFGDNSNVRLKPSEYL